MCRALVERLRIACRHRCALISRLLRILVRESTTRFAYILNPLFTPFLKSRKREGIRPLNSMLHRSVIFVLNARRKHPFYYTSASRQTIRLLGIPPTFRRCRDKHFAKIAQYCAFSYRSIDLQWRYEEIYS